MSKTKKSTAITIAASSAAARWHAVETTARRLDEEQTGGRLVRALLGKNGLHAVISDGKSTLEVADGQVALSVKQTD